VERGRSIAETRLASIASGKQMVLRSSNAENLSPAERWTTDAARALSWLGTGPGKREATVTSESSE
jgi:hypothetical protein